MEKEIVNQVQQAQRVPNRINQKRNMPRHILIKLTKTKHKEDSLIAQLVKNLPAMQETLVQFLGRKDLLEKG